MAFQYYYLYFLNTIDIIVTMDYVTTQYDQSESSIYRIISIIEQILIYCKKFTVKGKNKLKTLRNTKLVIDVTESEIERSKKQLLWQKEKTYIQNSGFS